MANSLINLNLKFEKPGPAGELKIGIKISMDTLPIGIYRLYSYLDYGANIGNL